MRLVVVSPRSRTGRAANERHTPRTRNSERIPPASGCGKYGSASRAGNARTSAREYISRAADVSPLPHVNARSTGTLLETDVSTWVSDLCLLITPRASRAYIRAVESADIQLLSFARNNDLKIGARDGIARRLRAAGGRAQNVAHVPSARTDQHVSFIFSRVVARGEARFRRPTSNNVRHGAGNACLSAGQSLRSRGILGIAGIRPSYVLALHKTAKYKIALRKRRERR